MGSGGKLAVPSPAKVELRRMPGMSVAATDFLAPLLTPHGHLLLAPDSDAPSLPAAFAQRLTDAFALGTGHGLLQLGGLRSASLCRLLGPGGVILPRAM